MRILSRRFLASYLNLFVVTLAIMTTVAIIFETLVDFDKIVEHRDAAGGALPYLFVRIPSLYLRDLIPIASFTAAFLCLGGAARANEVTAAKTAGIPPFRLGLPVLAASIALSGAALTLNETWLLGATREFDRIHHQGDEASYDQGSFWYHRGRSFYNIARADEAKGMLRDVTVYQLNNQGRLIESLYAPRVEIQSDGRWRLKNAVRVTFDPTAPELLPTRENLRSIVIDASSRSTLSLMDARENSLTLRELRDVIADQTADDRSAQRFRTMLHARLAMPLTVFLFALLGVPLGLSVERTRSVAVSAIYGLGAIALFHACWRTGSLMARSGFELAVLAPWMILTVFAAAGAILMVRTPR